jgi:hypothetical protein
MTTGAGTVDVLGCSPQIFFGWVRVNIKIRALRQKRWLGFFVVGMKATAKVTCFATDA